MAKKKYILEVTYKFGGHYYVEADIDDLREHCDLVFRCGAGVWEEAYARTKSALKVSEMGYHYIPDIDTKGVRVPKFLQWLNWAEDNIKKKRIDENYNWAEYKIVDKAPEGVYVRKKFIDFDAWKYEKD